MERNHMINRARFTVDLLYKGQPLPGPKLTRIANRMGTYLRTGAVEGLEGEIDVVFEESYRHQRAHHHDARFGNCRVEINEAQDQLGPIE